MQTRGMDEIDQAAAREGFAHYNRMVSIGDPRRPKPKRRGIRCGQKIHNPPPSNIVRPTLEQLLGFGDQRDRFFKRPVIRPVQPEILSIEEVIVLRPVR